MEHKIGNSCSLDWSEVDENNIKDHVIKLLFSAFVALKCMYKI